MLPRQLGAHFLPGGVHQPPVHHAVGPGEVNPFKDAQRPPAPAGGRVKFRMDAGAADDHHFPRFQLPVEFRLQMVQSAGFRGYGPAPAGQPSEAQRAYAQRVAGRDDRIGRQQCQRVGPLQHPHPGKNPFRPGGAGRIRQQVGDDLRVGGRLKGAMPRRPQLFPQFRRVDDVAVVRHRQRPVQALHQQRLGVAVVAGAGGGVAGMADGQPAGQPVDRAAPESFRHQPHPGVNADLPVIVRRGHPRRFLPPVLEGEQANGGRRGRVAARRVYAHHAALLAETVVRGCGAGRGRVVHGVILFCGPHGVNAGWRHIARCYSDRRRPASGRAGRTDPDGWRQMP